jgi:hypothetical protein
MGNSAGEKFVQEFVVGFGFLSGLFLSIGINPENMIIESLIKALSEINPDVGSIGLLFTILGILIAIFTLLAAYSIGGTVGVVALSIAFIGGIFYYSIIGWILLLAGMFLGLIAPDTV